MAQRHHLTIVIASLIILSETVTIAAQSANFTTKIQLVTQKPADPLPPANPAPAQPPVPGPPAAATIQQPSGSLDVAPTTPVLLICSVCSCPIQLLLNPYIIDCYNRSLTAIPDLDDYLRTNHSSVATVHLEMDNNNITVISRLMASTAVDLVTVQYSNVKSVVEYAFAGLSQLQRLYLAHNQLSTLSRKAFCGVDDTALPITHLDIGHNDLHSLDSELFKCLPDLQVLGLSGAPLVAVDASTTAALLGAPRLLDLDLSNALLSTLEMELKPMVLKLGRLVLSGNRMAGVPAVLQYAGELQELFLDENPMHELDALSFNGMNMLLRLDMAFSRNLTKIYSGTFHQLLALKTLNLNGNFKLTAIEPDSFPALPKDSAISMDKIDLSNNNLSSLAEELFEGTKIEHLKLGGNPFPCDCHIEWMIASAMVDANAVTCVINGTELVVDDLHFESLPCPGQTTMHTSFITIRDTISEVYIFLTVALLLAFFVLVATVVVLFRSKPEWRYSVLRVITPSRVPYKRSQDNNGFETLPDEPWVEFTRSEY